MENIFSINNFNIIEDEENYYFFRSLEPGDLKDLENGTIKENDEYTRLRTDRERWEEEHPEEKPGWNSESKVSLEEMYSHIKMHYSLQTNCISLTSNANVARTYGESFSDKYVMIRVPKREMGEKVFNAGQYMLQEIERIVEQEKEKQNLPEDVIEDLKAIDEAKTSDEIKEIIKTRYKSKEGIDVSKAGLKKGITYRSLHARISSYQSLNEEQTLIKNKIIAKLTVLERKQAMKPLMTRASNNNLLIQTVGSAFSSSEQIYYGDIDGDRIKDISKQILDIFGLLQQVEGQDEKIVSELKREVIKFVNEKGQLNIPEDSQLKKEHNLKDDITIEEMYELTNGKVEFGIANSIVKNMFYLSKGQQEARELSEFLRNITNNNPKYERVIEYIENNGFEIEPKICTRQSNRGYRLSESVNLQLNQNEISLVSKIKSLTDEEQIEILERGGLSDTRGIITDTFSRIQRDEKISREEYYAGAIIDSYNWADIGVEEFTIEQRNDFLQKLQEKDCVTIYNKLKEAGISEKDISTYAINVASKQQLFDILNKENYIELIQQNKETLNQKLSIPQIETFLGYYDIEGTNIVLRDYQRNAVEKADKIFENKRFASVVLPTGAGKSFVALTELYEHRNEPMLYLAPQNEILEQMKDYIIEYVHGKKETIGKTKEEIIAEVFPNIKFETYSGLLAQRGKKTIKESYGFIVLDELHRTGAKEWEGKLNKLLKNQTQNTKVLGITATPVRDVDDRNMAIEMALKLGYTKEEIQNREHIAINMDLLDAIKLGLVVNPKIVNCEYTIKDDKRLENLFETINSMENEEEKKKAQAKYETLRKNIDKAEGIAEIFKQNIKSGGKYIVFIPVTDDGEIEDEDGNIIGKKNGKEKIAEYEQKLREYMKEAGISSKCYSMLGAYSDKENEAQLTAFENDDSENAKFMVVMNKANEGLHIKGLDGIVWFRPLDENSKILYLQQLGRAIYSEDPNNSTPEDKRPVVIDLVNNTFKVDIDKVLKENTEKDDLELLTLAVDWAKLHNGLPNIESSDKMEQRYAATLYRIANKYKKRLNLADKTQDQVEEILKKGSEIDLWDLEVTQKQMQKVNKTLEVPAFEIKGVLKDLIELEKKVEQGIKKSTIAKTIEIAKKLNQKGVNLDKITLSKIKNGKQQFILLREIEQKGIDIDKIIEEEGLDGGFDFGQKINALRRAYNGNGGYVITKKEKKEAVELGLISTTEKSMAGKTLDIAKKLRRRGVDFRKIQIIVSSNKKRHYILLNEIKQDGIDIQKIIEEEGLDGNFEFGRKIKNIRRAYKGR